MSYRFNFCYERSVGKSFWLFQEEKIKHEMFSIGFCAERRFLKFLGETLLWI